MSPCFTLPYIQCLRLSEASSFRRKNLNMRNKLVMSRLVQINQPCSFFLFFFFYLGFLSRIFSNHRTAGEGGGLFFNSSLPLTPASRTLRHEPGDYCRELTSAHSSRTRTGNLWFPSTSHECLEGKTSQDTLPCR